MEELDQILTELNGSNNCYHNMDMSSLLHGSSLKRTQAIVTKPLPPVNESDLGYHVTAQKVMTTYSDKVFDDPLYENIQEMNMLMQSLDHSKALDEILPATSVSPRLKDPISDKTAALTTARQLDELLVLLSEFKLQQEKSVSSPLNESHHFISNSKEEENQTCQKELNDFLSQLRSEVRGDVAQPSRSICAGCNEPASGKIITALGREWHLEHFVCFGCNECLGLQNFYERDDASYCETCFQNKFSPQCAFCAKPILDKCVTAMDQTWHPEHFFCRSCQRPFDDTSFLEWENQPFCSECYYANFGMKCAGCNRTISGQYITAIEKQWHNHCFVCQECHEPFPSGLFLEHDGLPYCEAHFHAKRGSLCSVCREPVTGRCVNAMGRKFHPQHFVCTFCLKELNTGTFKEHSGQPYCTICSVKLFG